MQLEKRITDLENQIADRREFYNDSVNTFNTRIQQVPDTFVAGFMRLDAEPAVQSGRGGQSRCANVVWRVSQLGSANLSQLTSTPASVVAGFCRPGRGSGPCHHMAGSGS